MTDHTDLIENLRSKINPAYADVIGTESYERKVCLDAIEALVKELDGWKACAENRLEIQRMREGQLAALRDAIEAAEKVEPVAWIITTDNTNLHQLDPNRENNWLAFDVNQFKNDSARALVISNTQPLYLHPALDAAEKVEPVVRVWVGKVDGTDCRGIEFADMPEESAWNWMRLEDGEHDLYAHPAPAVPEGWVLVPKEPTDEMLVAAWNSARFGRSPKEDTSVWKAMLAASPKPEEEK